MNPTERLITTGAAAGSGGLIWGLTSGQVQSLLGIIGSLVMLIGLIGYVIYQWKKVSSVSKVTKAELETERAEKRAAEAKIEAAQAEAAMFRNINAGSHDS